MRLRGVAAAGAGIALTGLLAACGSSSHTAAPKTTSPPPPPAPSVTVQPAPAPAPGPKPQPKLVAVTVRDGDTGKRIEDAIVTVRHGRKVSRHVFALRRRAILPGTAWAPGY